MLAHLYIYEERIVCLAGSKLKLLLKIFVHVD